MTRTLSAFALICAATTLAAGCKSSPSESAKSAKPVTPASAQQQAALLDRVKSLEGTWVMTDDNGQTQVASVFTVTSNGSVVREVMFPGSSHEMTNMYHMDGPTMVVTHYCAQGNQPRMRSVAGASSDRIEMTFDSVTNMTASDQLYMGGLTLVFVDQDTITEEWTSSQAGTTEQHVVFTMNRQK